MKKIKIKNFKIVSVRQSENGTILASDKQGREYVLAEAKYGHGTDLFEMVQENCLGMKFREAKRGINKTIDALKQQGVTFPVIGGKKMKQEKKETKTIKKEKKEMKKEKTIKTVKKEENKMEQVKNMFKETWNKTWETTKEITDKVCDFFKSMWKKIAKAHTATINKFKEVWGYIVESRTHKEIYSAAFAVVFGATTFLVTGAYIWAIISTSIIYIIRLTAWGYVKLID